MQPSLDGLAQAFIIGADFVARRAVGLILGDNIFFGHRMDRAVCCQRKGANPGATVFAYHED